MEITQLEIRDVAKRYGRVRALAGVSATLHAGSVCALLGPNGAGKTTLLGIVSTLIRPTAGGLYCHRAGTVNIASSALRQHIGVIAHDSLLYGELTGTENLRLYGELYGIAGIQGRIGAIIRQVGLSEQAVSRRVRTYSRGMTQRLALARALLHEPKILLLDEPFTGLDQQGTIALSQVISRARSQGCVVLAATHNLEAIAGVADHVLVLRDGKVAWEERNVIEGKQSFSYEQLKELYHRHTSAPAHPTDRGPHWGKEQSS